MIMNELLSMRKNLGYTQEKMAQMLHVSRKTYIKYEKLQNENADSKYHYYVYRTKQFALIDEEHGILGVDTIKKIVNKVMKEYDIKSCFLFGSYAKGYAKEDSDVDLMIDSDITGLKYFGLLEELKESLHKKVDLLTLKSLSNNAEMLTEIIRDGVKIYGQPKE